MIDNNGQQNPENDEFGRPRDDRNVQRNLKPDDPTPGRKFLRSLENIVLASGICALVSLFLLNVYLGLLGILAIAYVLMRLNGSAELSQTPPSEIERVRKSAKIVLGLCVAVIAIDLILNAVFSSMIASYLTEAGQGALDIISSATSSGQTSTWG